MGHRCIDLLEMFCCASSSLKKTCFFACLDSCKKTHRCFISTSFPVSKDKLGLAIVELRGSSLVGNVGLFLGGAVVATGNSKFTIADSALTENAALRSSSFFA